MARQEVKPTLKFGFQVYRQFVCEEGFQDFCVFLYFSDTTKGFATQIKLMCRNRVSH